MMKRKTERIARRRTTTTTRLTIVKRKRVMRRMIAKMMKTAIGTTTMKSKYSYLTWKLNRSCGWSV